MKTPYLHLEYDRLVKNIRDLATLAAANGTLLRPHCKSHKTLEIARLQMEHGATGITAATLKEAEMCLRGGIPSVTLAYPLVDREKAEAFQALRGLGELRTIIISREHGEWMNQAFAGSEPLPVYLKIDSGLGRLGVLREEASSLASYLQGLDNLRLMGLLTHGGMSYSGALSLEEAARQEMESTLLPEHPGLIRSCGSTPSIRPLLQHPEVQEARPGNYVFYDRTMLALGAARTEQVSLFLKTMVLDRKEDRLIIDAGSKALSSDGGVHGNQSLEGYGLILEDPSLVLYRLSEEHGFVRGSGISSFRPGDILTIIPNHACATVNLHDSMEVWKEGGYVRPFIIAARGH